MFLNCFVMVVFFLYEGVMNCQSKLQTTTDVAAECVINTGYI